MQWQYPLANWKTARRGSVPFGVPYPKTSAMGALGGKKHVGTDVMESIKTPLYAPYDGEVQEVYGPDGGNMAYFIDDEFRYLHRFLHNSTIVKTGIVKKGDLIAYTGNTGRSTAPHSHIDISRSGKLELSNFNNFIDPEAFYKEVVDNRKIMTIRVLVCVSKKVSYNHSLLQSRLGIIAEWYRTHTADVVQMLFDIKVIDTPNMQWDETYKDPRYGNARIAELKTNWCAYRVVPYASGYDACILWCSPEEWKSPGSRAYSKAEKILGVHFIAIGIPETDPDDRWAGRYDNAAFTGALAHEMAHMFRQRSGSHVSVNDTGVYVPGMDNTHYFDFFERKLEGIFKDINLQNYKGWADGVYRLYGYVDKPSGKKWDFSGVTVNGCIYRSSDSRMFFEYQDKWESITDTEYNQKMKQGAHHVEMAVQEANKIQVDILGLQIPEAIGKMIAERVIQKGSWEEKYYKANGWTENIPTKHLT